LPAPGADSPVLDQRNLPGLLCARVLCPHPGPGSPLARLRQVGRHRRHRRHRKENLVVSTLRSAPFSTFEGAKPFLFGGAGGASGFVASRGFLVRHRSATEAPPKGLGGCFRWRSRVSVVHLCALAAVCCRVWRVVMRHRRGSLRHRKGSAPPGFGGASVAHQGPTETVLRSGRLGPGCPMLVGAGGLAGLGGLAGVLACVSWPGHDSCTHH